MPFDWFEDKVTFVLSALAAATLSLALAAAPAAAQQGSISGQVVDASNLEPVIGAQVFIPDLDLGTLTNEEGRYRITGVPAGTHQIRVRLLGYRTATRSVTVSSGETATADFQLSVSAVSLGEIVVTQTGERERRELGSAISTIGAADEIEKSKNRTVADLIKGRSTGATIRSSGGSVGTSSTFQIRGNTSINLDNTPVVYIDGVRIHNDNVVGGSGSGFGVGGQTTSRMNDLNPEDIESIEILKGPSATTLYGSEGASGVIRITTKSGTSGDTRYTFRGEVGANFNASDWNALAYNPASAVGNGLSDAFFFDVFGVAPRDTTYLIDLVEEDVTDVPLAEPPFRTGLETGYAGTVRGGFSEGNVTYYVSGEWSHNDGNTRPNVFEKWNARGNVSYTPSEKVDLSLSNGFTSNHTILPLGENAGGPVADAAGAFIMIAPVEMSDPNAGGQSVLTCPFEAELARSLGLPIADFRALGESVLGASPCTGFGSFRAGLGGRSDFGMPYFSNLTPSELENFVTTTDAFRYTGSADLTYRPVDWLTTRVTAGVDLTAQEQEFLQKVVPELVSVDEDFTGFLNRQNANTSVITLQTTNTAEFDITEEIRSTTTGGVQYFEDETDAVFAQGQIFPAGSPAVNNSVQTDANDFFTERRTIGLFGEQQFSWRNRLYLTGGVRADDATAFGGDIGMSVFPRAALSYVVSEEEWFPDLFESFRVRGAYGQSGRQPGQNAALALLTAGPTPFRGEERAAVSPNQPDNPELKPERDEEFEVGAEFSLLDGRVGGEFTWYHQISNDAIISRPQPVSTGFPNAQFSNIGEMTNRGIEAALDLTAFSLPDLQWDWRFQASTNYNEIVELGPPITFGFGLSALTNRHQEGEEFSSLWGFNPIINEAGEPETPAEPEILGAGTPNVNGSVSTTLTMFEHVTLYALADMATGHQQWSLGSLFNCGFVNGLFECAQNFEVGPDGQRTDNAKLRRFASQRAHIGSFVEDSDWMKLRTVSVSFEAPDSWMQFMGGRDLRLTLVGENLATWTGYSGTDPEVTTLNPDQFGAARVDFAAIPPARRFTAELSITF